MAQIDPKIKAKAEAVAGKKAKLRPCEETPNGTKAKKLTGPVLNTLQDHFGTNLKKIRVHTGGNVADIAKGLKARAFAIGPDIYFAKKGFAANNELVAHEVCHVVELAGGKVPKAKPGKVAVCKK